MEDGNIREVEVDGIELSIDVRRFEDPRFMRALSKMSRLQEELKACKDDARVRDIQMDMLGLVNRLYDTLFGDDTDRIMDLLAGGDVLPPEKWNDFVSNVMGEVGAKN